MKFLSSGVFVLQLRLLNADHVHNCCFKRRSEVLVLDGCHWRSIDECEVGIGVHQGFSYQTLGPLDYPDYLLPLLRTGCKFPSQCRLGSHNLGAVGHHAVKDILGLV